MKPVAVFQHTVVGQPGAVTTTLDSLGVPWVLVPMMDGAPVPKDVDAYSGLVFMGGGMGVNDGLPWIQEEIQLIQKAHAAGLPVAGHCLGSQILASAFGAKISKNPRMEIGWQEIALDSVPEVREWFGDLPADHSVFQWHGDTFDLPQGATRLASSQYCANQAFVLDNRHMATQFHPEMTPQLIKLSLEANGKTLDRELAAGNPAVTSREETASRLPERTAAMHVLLKNLYTRWAQGLAK